MIKHVQFFEVYETIIQNVPYVNIYTYVSVGFWQL